MPGMKSVSFTDPYSSEQAEIDRRMRMAQALQAEGSQGIGPTETVGGWAIQKSPLEGLSRAAQKVLGAYQENEASTMAKALQERAQGDRTADMTVLANALKGREAVPASSEQIVDEQAGGGMGEQAQINAPAMPARPGGQIDPSLIGQLRSPEMRNMGTQMWLQQMQRENAPPERVDLGDKIGLLKNGVIVGFLPKGATPDATLREQGSNQRHITPSGSAVLSEQGQNQRHITPSGSAILTDERTRSEGALGRGVTIRGQDLVDARSRQQAESDKFGPPQEVTGPNGPMLVMQNKRDGSLVDANTRQPVGQVGPKIGEAAQKQMGGVETTKEAITEYREALKNFSVADLAKPGARARMGTVYNNMLLQAKEAYNLGVLNGPDYQILQEVITNPASWTGSITSKKALDDQAKKLDEIMNKVGASVSRVQSGQTPTRRATDDPLGLRR